MANEYATLPELKGARRVQTAGDDTVLQSVLTRASRAIDARTGRRFYLDAAPSQRVFNPSARLVDCWFIVDDIGSTSGIVVEVGSDAGGWTTLTDYETGPENAIARNRPITTLIRPGGWWLGQSARLRVTARWGWPAVPDEIVQATLILANRLYLRKDSPEGVAGSSEWGVMRLSRLDPDVETLIGPYTLPGFG